MRTLLSPRWRHEHRRALRVLIAAGASLTLLTGVGTALAASTSSSGSPFGNEQVGGTYANGILLPTQQWIKPIGTRVLLDKYGRLLSSSISPNGQYLAALTWNDFTGWLSIINVKTGQIIQQVGTGGTGDPVIGDGTVAADGPLWSADGTSLWFPQTSDLVHFSVAADGTVSSPVVIPLDTTVVNLTTGDTTVPDGPSGMALSPDGSKLYVALNVVNKLGVINTATNKLIKVIKVGNAPRQVVLSGTNAFVSNEGGRPARPGDYTNNSAGTNIVANKVTGAASTGTVSEVSLVTGQQTKSIPVGLEPSAEYLAPGGTLMVANSNNDSISLINTRQATSSRPSTSTRCRAPPWAATRTPSRCRTPAPCWSVSGGTTPWPFTATAARGRRCGTKACCRRTSTRSTPSTTRPSGRSSSPTTRASAPAAGQVHRQGSRDRSRRRDGHRPQHLQ